MGQDPRRQLRAIVMPIARIASHGWSAKDRNQPVRGLAIAFVDESGTAASAFVLESVGVPLLAGEGFAA